MALFLHNTINATPTAQVIGEAANSSSSALGRPLIYFGNLAIAISSDQGPALPLADFTHSWLCFINWVWASSDVPSVEGSYCDAHEPSLQITWEPILNHDPWGGFWPTNVGEAAIVYLQKILAAKGPDIKEAYFDQFCVAFAGRREGQFAMRKIEETDPVAQVSGVRLGGVNATGGGGVQTSKRDLTGCQSSRLGERLKLLVTSVQRERKLSQSHFFGAIVDTLRRYVLMKKAGGAIPSDFLGQGDHKYIYARYRTVVMRVYVEKVDQGITRATWGDLMEALKQLVLLPDIVDGPYLFEATAHLVGKSGGMGSSFVRISLKENSVGLSNGSAEA